MNLLYVVTSAALLNIFALLGWEIRAGPAQTSQVVDLLIDLASVTLVLP